ncbi:MAG: phosphonate ABC transporter ATP-binding protein [Alphaproteobacteria bacterium]
MTAIEVKGLTKTFGKTNRALDDVSLSIEQGEMVALIGASGSGKSTLIRHIAGLIEGDRRRGVCSVNVLGQRVQNEGRISSAARDIRTHIGVIFQQFNLVERMSVLSNVLVGVLGRVPRWRGYLGLFTKEEKSLAMSALERVGIAATVRQRASTLSGGQQQRAAIARALVQKSKIVLADEPIASLDPASSKRVMETLRKINEEDDITVVVSLHQVDYAYRYCPRTVALRDGKIIYDGPSDALTPAFLHDLYGAASDELILGERAAADGATEKSSPRPSKPALISPAPRPDLSAATA